MNDTPRDPTEDEAIEILVIMKLRGFDRYIGYELLQNYVRWLRGEPQQGWAQGLLDRYIPVGRNHGRYQFRNLWAHDQALLRRLGLWPR